MPFRVLFIRCSRVFVKHSAGAEISHAINARLFISFLIFQFINENIKYFLFLLEKATMAPPRAWPSRLEIAFSPQEVWGRKCGFLAMAYKIEEKTKSTLLN